MEIYFINESVSDAYIWHFYLAFPMQRRLLSCRICKTLSYFLRSIIRRFYEPNVNRRLLRQGNLDIHILLHQPVPLITGWNNIISEPIISGLNN